MVLLVESLEGRVENGSLCLTYEDILAEYNLDKEKKLNGAAISSILRKQGFTPMRNKERTKRGIFFDKELINNLKELNNIESEKNPSATILLSERTEESEVSEDLGIDPDKLPF